MCTFFNPVKSSKIDLNTLSIRTSNNSGLFIEQDCNKTIYFGYYYKTLDIFGGAERYSGLSPNYFWEATALAFYAPRLTQYSRLRSRRADLFWGGSAPLQKHLGGLEPPQPPRFLRLWMQEPHTKAHKQKSMYFQFPDCVLMELPTPMLVILIITPNLSSPHSQHQNFLNSSHR